MSAAGKRHLALIHTLICVEQWRVIPGWEECYEASDLGRIRSLTRVNEQPRNGRHVYAGKILRQANVRGYRTVHLTKPGQRSRLYVHRLVLLAFAGDPINRSEACHGNGIKHDNRLCNLRWDSRIANMLDRKKHGTQQLGQQMPLAKLTDEAVREIRASTDSLRVVCLKYNITKMTASKARRGLTWKHVT